MTYPRVISGFLSEGILYEFKGQQFMRISKALHHPLHNCCFAAETVITKSFDESNIVLAVVPAGIVRRLGDYGTSECGTEYGERDRR